MIKYNFKLYYPGSWVAGFELVQGEKQLENYSLTSRVGFCEMIFFIENQPPAPSAPARMV